MLEVGTTSAATHSRRATTQDCPLDMASSTSLLRVHPLALSQPFSVSQHDVIDSGQGRIEM